LFFVIIFNYIVMDGNLYDFVTTKEDPEDHFQLLEKLGTIL
jgi:hypothetical protein